MFSWNDWCLFRCQSNSLVRCCLSLWDVCVSVVTWTVSDLLGFILVRVEMMSCEGDLSSVTHNCRADVHLWIVGWSKCYVCCELCSFSKMCSVDDKQGWTLLLSYYLHWDWLMWSNEKKNWAMFYCKSSIRVSQIITASGHSRVSPQTVWIGLIISMCGVGGLTRWIGTSQPPYFTISHGYDSVSLVLLWLLSII